MCARVYNYTAVTWRSDFVKLHAALATSYASGSKKETRLAHTGRETHPSLSLEQLALRCAAAARRAAAAAAGLFKALEGLVVV